MSTLAKVFPSSVAIIPANTVKFLSRFGTNLINFLSFFCVLGAKNIHAWIKNVHEFTVSWSAVQKIGNFCISVHKKITNSV